MSTHRLFTSSGPRPADAEAEVLPAGHGKADTYPLGGRTTAPAHIPLGWRVAKRTFDIVFSVFVLIALLPVFLVIAAVIKLTSPGPVFFRQVRIGRNEEPFTVLKFRTMYRDVSPETHQAYIAYLAENADGADDEGPKKLVNDPRVTPVGRFLRRFSLDELPQFVNVLAGSMSVIGPRPAIDYELEHYAPEHFRRFDVRPGLTGLWQVSGRSELGFVQMLELDAEYARRTSFRTDLGIFLRTPLALFDGV